MSNTESFINEVSESLRKDRLYAIYRRWAWVGVLIIVLIVVGAIGVEWVRARTASAQEAAGDAIFTALRADAPSESARLLGEIDLDNAEARAMVALKRAALLLDGGERAQAVAVLETVRGENDYSDMFRDLADLKSLLIQGADLPADDRRARFDALARNGGAFRLLAMEQLALLSAEAGDTGAALAGMVNLLAQDGISEAMGNRLRQTIVSMGGDAPVVDTGAGAGADTGAGVQ